MKQYLKKITSNLGLGIIITILFFLWVFIFDRNSYVDVAELDKSIKKMEDERDFYREKIREDSIVISNLRDSAYVEKFARENYQMKRPGEKVYIVK